MQPTDASEHDARKAQDSKVKVVIRKLDRIETTAACSDNT